MAKTTRARSSDFTSMRTVFWCRGLGGLVFHRTVRPDRWVTLENQARRAMICQWYADIPADREMNPLMSIAIPVKAWMSQSCRIDYMSGQGTTC